MSDSSTSQREWTIRILLAVAMAMTGWITSQSGVVTEVRENTIRVRQTQEQFNRVIGLMETVVEQNRDLLAYLQAEGMRGS